MLEMLFDVRYPSRMKMSALYAAFTVPLLLSACKSTTTATAPPAASNPSNATAQPRQLATAPANFDFYLLNLSWSPEYCHSHPSAAECSAHDAFVLHGLWPENANGKNPENCSNAPGPADPSAYRDIYPDSGLLEHEWKTHGTCSGLSVDEFFNTARAAYQSVKVPSTLSGLTSQTSMPPAQILGLFTQTNPAIPLSSLALSCGNNYLTAVEVCLDKSLHPTACTGVRSCRANTVRIPPP
jgi:ribonuclease T2